MDKTSRYVLRRLLVLAVGILAILTIEFVILRVIPDDPIRWVLSYPGDSTAEYAEWAEEVVDEFEQPLYVQYFRFIVDMLTGDFGYNYRYHTNVDEFVNPAMWRTLTLFVASLSLCLVLGSLVGRTISRVKSYLSRQAISITSLVFFSLVVVAWQWVFMRYLCHEWRLLPAFGSGDFENMIMPIASVVLASVGAFILSTRDGQTKASAALPSDKVSLRDGLFAALPNLQYMAAGVMFFVIASEAWFDYPGLGFFFILSLYEMDYFMLQAIFFLLVTIVFASNYVMETVVTLVRPGRRLDLYLREDDGMPTGMVSPQAHADPSPLSMASIRGALGGIARDYLRSPVGLVSLFVLMAVVVLAVVGPSFASDQPVLWPEVSALDLFLVGATALIAVSVIVGLLASSIGMALGMAMGFLRSYADGVVAAVMHGLMATPVACLLLVRMSWPWRDFGYLRASLVLCLPVVALVSLLVCHGFVSSRRRETAAADGSPSRVKLARSIPAVVTWMLGGLKYGLPMTAIALFLSDLWNLTPFDSWGQAVHLGLMYHGMHISAASDYILLPLLGMFFLVGSMFLVFDTLEMVIRTRFSDRV